MEPTVAELAEDAAAHVLPRPGFETIDRDEFFFEAGRHRASMQRLRLDDVEATVAWAREECARREDHAVRMVGRLERDAGGSRRPAHRSRLRPRRRGGDADRDEHRPRAAGRAARRRAADRDARAAARGARGRLGRLEPARGRARLTARVRARALRPERHRPPLRRLRGRPARRLRPRDRHGRRRRADGRRRPAGGAPPRRLPRARPRALAARRRARNAAARRAGGPHVGAGAHRARLREPRHDPSCSSIR